VITIDIHDKEVQSCPFPSTWDELTLPELEAVAALLITEDKDTFEEKIKLFIFILNGRIAANKLTMPRSYVSKLMDEEVAIATLDALQFIFEKNERTINPYKTLKLPGIVGARRVFHGPSNDFNDITCAELEDANHLVSQFAKTQKLETLASLASIFWRLPINKNILQRRQHRFPYEDVKSEYYASHFMRLPAHVLMSCYIYIVGCMNQLPKYFPGIYGSGDGKAKSDQSAFTKCIHAGAGVKNGTRDNIRKMLAKEFLYDMQQEYDQAKAQEKEMKKANSKK